VTELLFSVATCFREIVMNTPLSGSSKQFLYILKPIYVLSALAVSAVLVSMATAQPVPISGGVEFTNASVPGIAAKSAGLKPRSLAGDVATQRLAKPRYSTKKKIATRTVPAEAQSIHQGHHNLHPNLTDGSEHLATF
jgi:hypothetical protein